MFTLQCLRQRGVSTAQINNILTYSIDDTHYEFLVYYANVFQYYESIIEENSSGSLIKSE